MSPKRPLNTKEITELLSKLKAETPDYPSELMAARKATFLKQAVNIKIDQSGQGGQHGGSGGSGGSGTALGGGSVPGVLLQALIGITVVTALLLVAYAYRDQSGDTSQGDKVVVQEELAISSPLALGTVTIVPGSITPEFTVTPESTPTGALSVPDDIIIDGSNVVNETQVVAGDSENNGLHLGQTPGTPAAPGHGNPGNLNQPDRPDKPDKPDKPEKPQKPEKTKKAPN